MQAPGMTYVTFAISVDLEYDQVLKSYKLFLGHTLRLSLKKIK
jgi:hypothetical protein